MDKLIISVATTGSWTTRQQTPYVPITEEEIAEQAVQCWREGAAIVHIHVRDDEGRPTCDPARYARVRELIRARGCDLIINMSTGGGAGQVPDEERIAPVRLRPEIASFDAGSLNFGERVFVNSPQFLEALAQEMQAYGVKPEIECFESGFIENARRFIERGLFQPPYWFQMVLGVRGGAPATVDQLVHMVRQLPPNSLWSVCAIGRHQLPLNVAAMVMGGHVRTGLEDNIYYSYRVLAEGNAPLVARLVRIARELGREVATPAEARQILGLPEQPEA
ncbi:3-keto-5-aminohexanoate cleavage protein [Thermomicrobiaceae bacterium CFH 74404]|uniref:3-keto-5-aminohexanoate cleavage protein n=1 Tax=Thermalbibacter longus TaxID=2951981 RepID=A0AA41WA56_9BACT|nr:3-keto-5-aminohexanoate cleavage protein [Thermalbibacter longus]MCM8748362.1 3-keto-5-aminohexanoate cleavage protein [Thermalbibacter longus]